MAQTPFRPDSPLMRAIGRVGDLALLNVLFLLCSIPVFTLGASAAALYTVTLQIVRREEGKIVKTFFSAFKQNLGQSTVLTLIFLVLFAGLYLDVRVMQANSGTFPLLLRVGTGVAAILICFTASYVFALQAKFNNTIWGTLKNAFILSCAHPLSSVVIAVLTFLPIAMLVFATYYFLMASIVFFLFWFACAAALNSYLFERIFKKVLQYSKPEKTE
ncbi:MAG: DUF624 domain-containing protein [Clostridiaceae bacterium]|nr:DUF624 domain-containing protein [Feifaniaceae bacterium]